MKWPNFTAPRVAAFQCAPGKKQSIFWDGRTPGLGLRVTAGGAKSYIFEATLHSKTVRITIGDIATYSIDAAQREASELKAMTNRGIDPRQVAMERRDAALAHERAKEEAAEAQARLQALAVAKREVSARDAWDAYLGAPHPRWGEQHRKDHEIAARSGGMVPKTGKSLTKAAPLARLLDMPLHDITASVVSAWLQEECLARPTFAHNCYRKFKAFVRWAAKQPAYRELVHAECCHAEEVRDVVPSKKTKDGDCLQREQLAAWFKAVRGITNPVICAYLQALLITGARRGELAELRWQDVVFNKDWSSLTIKDKDKSVGHRTIPLPPYLMQVLTKLPRRNEWVFSSVTAESGHITEPRIAHTRALREAGLPHVSLHGLRRSFGTLAEWVEAPTGVVAQIQGHKPSALAEKHYRRRPLDLLRKWHVRIEAWMLEEGGVSYLA
jgi:hypothetical protein